MNLAIIYRIRYEISSLQQRTESAVMVAVQDILSEDPATPDHGNRLAWAEWANLNSNIATIYFMWSIAMNPSIQDSVEADSSGASVPDGDIQFVVNSSLSKVIADCIKNPPAGFTPPT